MPPQVIKPYVVEPVRGLSGSAPALDDPSQDARWFAADLKMAPLSARHCVVRNPLNGASAELSSVEYAILTASDGCRTLAEHEERAARKLSAPAVDRPVFRELLARCARSGLLMTVAELAGRFGAPTAERSREITHVVVRTADRPQLLARLLSSATALEARTGSHRRWIVIDDSRDAANERANRTALEACRTLETEHLDHGAAAETGRALRSEFPDLDGEIEWLLAPGSHGETTAGVPINHALLRLAGRAFVSFDDDSIIDPRRPALCEPGFAVSDAVDEFLPYESEAALWRDCPPLDLDPIAAHAQWIGLPMAQAWRRAEQQCGTLAAMEIGPAELERFAGDARVLFTHNHACGDPGSSMLPIQLFALPLRSRQWLASHPEAASHGFASRIDWRGQTRLRLAPTRDLTLTTLAGIDNTRLLPPAARSHRNQDLLVGRIAQRMYPTSWVVDLPFGLPHLRAPAKHWIRSGEAFMQEPLHVVLSHLTGHASDLAASSAEQRLAAMGTLLLDLAAASETRLRETLLQHTIETGSHALFLIHEQLDDATLPARWRSALEAWLQSPALKPDAAHARVVDLALIRTLLNAYGRAMISWPRLWNRCRERNR
jgi:hypothetical protein